MHILIFISSLWTFAHVAHSKYSGKWCPVACETTLNYATFNDTDAWLSRKVRSCRSNLHIASLYLCFEDFCSEETLINAWIEEHRLWCDEHAGVVIPTYHDVVSNWTSDEKDKLPRLAAEKAMKWPVLNDIMLPDNNFFKRAFTTMVGFLLG